LRSQTFNLLICHLKHEVAWKTIPVPTHLLVEAARANAIKLGEIGIEHDFLATNDQDARSDVFHRFH